MKPNIIYTYEEWLDMKKPNAVLNSPFKEISQDTAKLMLYSMKSFSFDSDSKLTNEETIHQQYLLKSLRIRTIEVNYTEKNHEITFLFNSLAGKYGRELAPIYTKIGKLKCELIKIKNECKEIEI